MTRSGQPMDAKSYKQWQKTRQLGKKRYVLQYGVLGWGLTTASLFSLFPLILGEPFDWFRAQISFVLFPIGGIFWGVLMWNMMEKRFALGQKKQDDRQD